jgi:hypothetical protein
MRPMIVVSAFAVALAACTTTGAQPANTVADGSRITLAPGQSASLADNSRIDYVKVDSDSRCRPDVQCVWAGDAVVVMRWTPAAAMTAQDFVLHTTLDPKSFDSGSRTVTLVSLDRGDAPKATLQVELNP